MCANLCWNLQVISEKLVIDSALPQFDIARNAKKMLSMFQKSLRPTGEKRFLVEQCQVSRFRYRKGQRSIILYQLRLRETNTGKTLNQWVTGVIYADHNRAEQLYRKLRRSPVIRKIPDEWQPFEPVCYIRNLRMLVQIFPLDRYLDTLPRILNHPTPELEALLLEEFDDGRWELRRWDVQPTRYRPFLGVTLRCNTVARNSVNGELSSKCFYIKLYRDDSGRQAYELLRRLQAATVQRTHLFEPIRPVAYITELRTLILEEASGQSLEQILIGGKGIKNAMKQTALAMVALHQSDLFDGEPRTPESALTRAERAIAFIQWACPSQRQKACEILKALEERLEIVDACPVHLDFKADHIFIDGNRTLFIDLDSFGTGDPVFDPATLIVRLRAMPDLLPISLPIIEEAVQTFTQEYFQLVPSSWRKRLAINITLASLKVALYYVQHQEPDWKCRVAVLLNQAATSLSKDPRSQHNSALRPS